MRINFQAGSLIFCCVVCLYDAVLVSIKIANNTYEIEGRTIYPMAKEIYHFSKIPYAKPPVGDRRFRHPEELDIPPWSGVYNSTVQPPTCYQANASSDFDLYNPASNMWFSRTQMSEDCLYLTIWTPQIDLLLKPLPVMIWIYGGSYMAGSSTLEVYDGSILASRANIVIVSFQFRVGPFGFLFLDDIESPGNQALMDHRMLLKWVQKHIKSFGGDPNLITLFGESSGANSISLHLFSSMTNNLFQKAILQSGTILAPWAIESSSSAYTKGKYLANVANCSSSSNREVVQCLRRLPAVDIVKYNYDIRYHIANSRKQKLRQEGYTEFYSDVGMFFDIYFRPIIDQKFITKEEIQRITEGSFPTDKDVMVGSNSNEAVYFLMYGLTNFSFFDKSKVQMPPRLNYPSPGLIDSYNIVLENILDLDYLYPSLATLILYEYNIKSTRFNDESWTAKDLLTKLDLLGGDTQFVCPTVQFADSVTKFESTKLFMYVFSKRTTKIPVPNWLGVMHGYEIEYVFGMPFSQEFTRRYYTFNEEESKISDLMMKMWTNFAKYGNPTPANFERNITWPTYTARYKQYLKITNKNAGGIRMETNLKDKTCKFWTKVLPELKNNLLKRSNGCSGLQNGSLFISGIIKLVASVIVALQLAISH